MLTPLCFLPILLFPPAHMGPWQERGVLRKGYRAPPSTRESLCWWSPATIAPARHVKRRARTWHHRRTKKSWGTLTLQQVNRCPVVLSVLMNNWRWILKSHLLHSYFPPSAVSQQPHSLCSGSERLHCWVHISCVSRPQIEVLTADLPWYFWLGFALFWWGQISDPSSVLEWPVQTHWIHRMTHWIGDCSSSLRFRLNFFHCFIFDFNWSCRLCVKKKKRMSHFFISYQDKVIYFHSVPPSFSAAKLFSFFLMSWILCILATMLAVYTCILAHYNLHWFCIFLTM